MSSRIAAVSLSGYSFYVFCDYQPKEEATNEYPGCPEDLDITNVHLHGEDVMELLKDEVLIEIKTKILGDDCD